MLSEVELNALLDLFTTQVRRREIVGSGQIAIQTAKLLREVIASTKKNDNTQNILNTIRSVGRRLTQAQPMALAIGNIVRRILFIIREEYAQQNQDITPSFQPTLHGLLASSQTIDYTRQCDIKPAVIETINELIDEITHIHRSIASQATQHIHANEVILTYGTSRTVEEFLKEAAKKDRPFEAIVAENAPLCTGHQLAQSLSKDGISTTLIPDAAVISMMARVNKVIIGTYAVMANGGILAPSGTHMIAVAAKQFSVPLVVCCGLYKLTPSYPTDQDSFNDKYSPSEVLSGQDGANIDEVPVYNPAFDYIPPELIDLFVTNEMYVTSGGHNPSYIYRLLADHYNPEDYEL